MEPEIDCKMQSNSRYMLWASTCAIAASVVLLADASKEPFVGLTREDFPDYHAYLAAVFASIKNKPRVIEEYDSLTSVISAIEAGTGVGLAVLGFSFGSQVKLVRVTPEPKPFFLRHRHAKRPTQSRHRKLLAVRQRSSIHQLIDQPPVVRKLGEGHSSLR
jgi:DNA-binding transcriptional LysR family regulator